MIKNKWGIGGNVKGRERRKKWSFEKKGRMENKMLDNRDGKWEDKKKTDKETADKEWKRDGRMIEREKKKIKRWEKKRKGKKMVWKSQEKKKYKC